MAPNVYTLLEPMAFSVPVNPGHAPVYTVFAPSTAIKMVDTTFEAISHGVFILIAP
jgi:hypothetical protein